MSRSRTLTGTRVALLWSVALFAGCGAPQSVLDGASPAADTIGTLGWFVLILAVVVLAVVIALVVVGATRRRGTLSEHLPYDIGGGQSWILIGGFAAPAVIFGIVFASTLGTLAKFPMGEVEEGAPKVRVVGHQWWWEVKYDLGDGEWITSANEIHIPAGKTVEVTLETVDVIHSFWVPRLFGKVDLIPGQRNHFRLQADAPGVFRGQCAEFCGQQHSNMAFLVVAHAPDEFEVWLARERAPATEPASEAATLGKQVFETNACAFCHTIRGTESGGTVAPNLTHLGSRRTIAAGMLPNTRGHLQAWVVNAPSLKPGTQMPAMTQLSGSELNALVSYLESLK